MRFERFAVILHAVRVQVLGYFAVVIFGEQLADGAPEVPQKAVGVRSAFDNDAGQRR